MYVCVDIVHISISIYVNTKERNPAHPGLVLIMLRNDASK